MARSQGSTTVPPEAAVCVPRKRHDLGSRCFGVCRSPERIDADAVVSDARVERLIATVQANGLRLLEPVERDLLRLAANVVSADRSQRRPKGFNRRIDLLCGVEALALWTRSRVGEQLRRCLKTLTRDAWQVTFRPATGLQTPLALGFDVQPSPNGISLAYSDGLDSLATRALLEDASRPAPLCVTVVTRGGIGCRIKASGAPREWARAAFEPGAGKHAEPTFRSRSFLFLAATAVTSRLQGIRRMVVPETGQGAIGAALTPIDERPALGAHPRFTDEMMRLFELLWPNDAPHIEHPNLWLTKAELVRSAFKPTRSCSIPTAAISATRSCTNRKLISGIEDRACGICPNCLTRRVALCNAGLPDVAERERFIWQDLAGPSLEAGISRGLPTFPVTGRHREIARAAVLVHDDLAALAVADPFNKIPAEVRNVAQALDTTEQEVASRLLALLGRHRDEWNCFLDRHAPRGSWLRAICR
jgi:hypothetical protein